MNRLILKIGNQAFRIWLAVMVPLVIALTVRGLTRDYCFADYPPGPGYVGDILNRCWPGAPTHGLR